MRIKTILYTCVLTLWVCLGFDSFAQNRFMVMSDAHVLDRSLFNSSAPFEGNARLVEKSADLFDQAIEIISAEKPDLLLIPGDMSSDGEKVSHEYVASKLNALVESGIKVLVVPGNHDINNPFSYNYNTEIPTPQESVSEEDFLSIYSRCGYSEAIERFGLSYLAFPCDGVAFICLDSRKPDTENVHYSEGGLAEETILWAEKMAKIARAQGRVVFGMMHHPIMEHYDGHAEIATNYIANQTEGYPELKAVQQRLVNAGIGVMFTGHYHLQSVQHEIIDGKELWDVMTGSLSTYPMPMRKGVIDAEGNLSITSELVGEWQELGKIRNQNTTNNMFAKMARTLFPKLNQKKEELGEAYAKIISWSENENELIDGMNQYMLDSYTELINSLSIGDEEQDSPEVKYKAATNGFDDFIKSFVVGGGLLKDLIQVLLLSVVKETDEYKLLDKMNKSIFYNYKTTEENVVADNMIDIRSISSIKIPDLNNDGIINNGDIVSMVVNIMLGIEDQNVDPTLFDFENDGVSVTDLTTIISTLK